MAITLTSANILGIVLRNPRTLSTASGFTGQYSEDVAYKHGFMQIQAALSIGNKIYAIESCLPIQSRAFVVFDASDHTRSTYALLKWIDERPLQLQLLKCIEEKNLA